MRSVRAKRGHSDHQPPLSPPLYGWECRGSLESPVPNPERRPLPCSETPRSQPHQPRTRAGEAAGARLPLVSTGWYAAGSQHSALPGVPMENKLQMSLTSSLLSTPKHRVYSKAAPKGGPGGLGLEGEHSSLEGTHPAGTDGSQGQGWRLRMARVVLDGRVPATSVTSFRMAHTRKHHVALRT